MGSLDSPSVSTAPSGPGPLPVTGRHGWDQHPGVRTGRRLRPGEHVAEVFCRVAGSWAYHVLVVVGVLVAAAVALSADRQVDAVTCLAVGVSALALIEVSLVPVAARRAERIAAELALYDLDQVRRANAVAEDLRREMQRMHADIARIAAYSERAGYPARHP